MKLIGEIGINITNSEGTKPIEIAKQLINMAKGCGCYAVKFQKRNVKKVYAKELNKPRNDGNPYGWKTYEQQKSGIELSFEDYQKINYHCKMVGIPWFASAWDTDSLDFLEQFNPPFHKIASPMITNLKFCAAVASLGRKTFISTGMCKLENILEVHDIFKNANCEFVIMHCVSEYPTKAKDANIKMVEMYQGMFPGIEIGYSSHDVTLWPALVAVAYGAEWIEKHITLGRHEYGSDHSSSTEASGIAYFVEVAKYVEECIGDGKKRITDKELENAKKLRYFES